MSEYFTVIEFACHDGTPAPRRALPAVRRLCLEVLEPLRIEFGPVRIVSGHRTPTWNRRVGGARHSRHLYEEFPGSPAVDVTCAEGSPRDWYGWLDALEVGGLGYYPGHVHVDQRPRRTRW